MYTIFVLITAKFGMQQKKSARKLVKVVKNLYFCNKFYALLSVNISMTTSSSYLWSDYLHSIILRITQMNAELHVSLSNGHAIGKGSSNYRKFNENSMLIGYCDVDWPGSADDKKILLEDVFSGK